MVKWIETNSGIYVTDEIKNELSINIENWEYQSTEHEITQADETVSGYATEIRFPSAFACIFDSHEGCWLSFGVNAQPLHLKHQENHIIQIQTNIKTYIQTYAQVTLQRDPIDNSLIFSFSNKSKISIGFQSTVRKPEQEFMIPRTLTGIASAIRCFTSAHKTTSPDRSYPTLRTHPPLIKFGKDFEIPDGIHQNIKKTNIKFHLPKDIKTLFVAAPLAYYLQASILFEEKIKPSIQIPINEFSYEFSTLPDFQYDASKLLRRVFLLDCLVRNAGPYGAELAEQPVLSEVNIDAEEAYQASPAKRLETYLTTPFDQVDEHFCDWHFSMYVEPCFENIQTLPYLLDRLSTIYLPQASKLEREDLIDQSLSSAYRSSVSSNPNSSIPAINPLDPQLQSSKVHGWLAKGTPIDVFKALPIAFKNRFEYFDNSDERTKIVIVLNDPRMNKEQIQATQIYEERANNLSICVRIKEQLDRNSLAAIFEQSADFVHYIGHCEVDGLRCRDGNLSINEIKESNVETFFLNACGSYNEGIDLIQKGSVAGAVTLNTVLNKPAATVGTTLARLLIHGFDITRALKLARRRILMNKNYVVVGDGTHSLIQGDDFYPAILFLRSQPTDSFELTWDVFSPSENGGFYQPEIDAAEKSYLFGSKSSFELSRSELSTFLAQAKAPVIYDGQYYWSEDLAHKLSTSSRR